MRKKLMSKDQLSGIIVPKSAIIILCNELVANLIKEDKVDIKYNVIFINNSLEDDELIQVQDDKLFEIHFK